MDLISKKITEAIRVVKKDVEPCVKQADFIVPPPQVKASYEIILKEYAKNADIPGFRKGKAPPNIVKNLYDKKVQSETIYELMGACFAKATEDEDCVPDSAGFPKDVKPPEQLDLAADFTVSLMFNVYPKFDLPEYKGIKIESPKNKTSDEELEKRLTFYREIYGRFEKVDAPAEKGDMLKVSYSSDVELPPDTPEHVRRMVKADENYIWLNDNEMLPGANACLIGGSVGKTCETTVEFPVTHEEKALAGKKGSYAITILEVQRKRPLTDDQELFSKFMVKNVEELKDTIRKQLDRESKRETDAAKRTKVLDAVTVGVDFPVPPVLVEEVTQSELRKIINGKIKPDASEEEMLKEFEGNRDVFMAEARQKATYRVRQFLVLREIAKKEGLKVEQEEFNRHIQGISDYLGYSSNNLMKRLADTGRLAKVVDDCLAGKVTDFLVANSQEI